MSKFKAVCLRVINSLKHTLQRARAPPATARGRLDTRVLLPQRFQSSIYTCRHHCVKMRSRTQTDERWGMSTEAVLSHRKRWICITFSFVWDKQFVVFTLLSQTGLRSDVSTRVGRRKLFSQAIRATAVHGKSCPLSLNGICYMALFHATKKGKGWSYRMFYKKKLCKIPAQWQRETLGFTGTVFIKHVQLCLVSQSQQQ